MKDKKILFPGLLLMILAQLYVPARMIYDAESILTDGTEFKFKTAPIDPVDPFRGKFVALTFDANSAQVANAQDWNYGEPVFVSLTTDENGFAKIAGITKEEPVDEDHYVSASILHVVGDSISHVAVAYPFDRFYMEESKAYDAELAYNESALDSNQIAYALVAVKKGEAAIKEVYINGMTIREAAIQHMENPDN